MRNSKKLVRATLKNFYTDWLIWVSDGAPQVKPFERHLGLCHALIDWSFENKLTSTLMLDAKDMLKQDFVKEGLDMAYPFGEEDWDMRSFASTMHLCPKRLAFVHKMIRKI